MMTRLTLRMETSSCFCFVFFFIFRDQAISDLHCIIIWTSSNLFFALLHQTNDDVSSSRAHLSALNPSYLRSEITCQIVVPCSSLIACTGCFASNLWLLLPIIYYDGPFMAGTFGRNAIYQNDPSHMTKHLLYFPLFNLFRL